MKRRLKKDAQFVFQNSKKDWFHLAIIILLKVLMVYLSFQHPIIQSLIVDHGLNFQPNIKTDAGIYSFFFNGKFGADGSLELVIWLACSFFLVIFLYNLCNYFIGSLTTLFKAKNKTVLRKKAFNKFCRCNAKHNNGELMVLLNEDIAGVSDFLFTSIPTILIDIFTLYMAISTLSAINAYLLIVPLIACPILLIPCIIYIKKLYNSQLTIREKGAQIKTLLQGSFEGIKTIRLLNRTDFSRRRFKKKNIEYTTAIADKNQLTNKFNLCFNIIKKSAYVLSILVGGLLAIKNLITIGQFLVFTTFVVSLLDAVTTTCGDVANSKLYILQNRKLQSFFEEKDDVEECENPQVLDTTLCYDISFDKVVLDIQDNHILQDISFTIPKGKSLGIIGNTGEGKTALIKGLMRILDYQGNISIGDTEIKQLSISNLRDLISFHTQNPSVFNLTVRENLLYSNSTATDAEIKDVLKLVYADYFTDQVSLDYLITDCGKMFGDYNNRLSIARAILKQAPIYIFDDFTYGYSNTEKKSLCKNIIKCLPDKNVIFVATSYDDVKNCDLILKINNHHIEYFGKASAFKEKTTEVQHE